MCVSSTENSYFNKILPLGEIRLAGLVSITEKESGVGRLGWLWNFTLFDGKNMLFPVLRKKRRERLVK